MLKTQIEQKLKQIYQDEYQAEYLVLFEQIIAKWQHQLPRAGQQLTEQNTYLITYGDSIYDKSLTTFPVLHRFLKQHVGKAITDVHILPMFPYTSDDGFSVVDYRKIDPQLGNWQDLQEMAHDYRLMYDFVANHISKSSDWFQGFLNQQPQYADYFIEYDADFDASGVTRPRVTPLFHTYGQHEKQKTVWTTFSEDQIDVNVKNIHVLVELTDIFLEYISHGARSIRLDAIGFLWKESGTTCIHLPQTHAIIQLWRELVDGLQLDVQIITETNVPHVENVSYFGNGTNEAHMVYQFTLPPLMLHTIQSGDAKKLSEWASQITNPSASATYFNFLSSHDGIGVRPVEGILDKEQIDALITSVESNGGRVSYKNNPDGTKSPYELNINYIDALRHATDIDETISWKKSILAHAFLMSFIGVPAIYYHTLFGSDNDIAGMESSGINRRINREKLDADKLAAELENDPRRNYIFSNMKQLLEVRQATSAFHPFAEQRVLTSDDDAIIIIERGIGDEMVRALYNFSAKPKIVPLQTMSKNIFNDELYETEVQLNGYSFVWLQEQ
ncbi:sugar phosphorylase [Culicoidibacter larvae]